MKSIVAFLILFLSVTYAHALECIVQDNGCDEILSAPNGLISLKNTNKAGKTLCIQTGTYRALEIINVQGEQGSPVTITNCGGQVSFNTNGWSNGITGINSRYIHLTGSGESTIEYGITQSGAANHGIELDYGSSDIEIDHLEIAHNGYGGIMFRTYPRCDGAHARGAWAQYNTIIHNNYVHDLGGEGFYIGTSHYHSNSPRAYILQGCPESGYLEAPLVNVKIYENRIEDVGLDGIQVGGAIEGLEIHHNIVKRYAGDQTDGHTGGILLNPGSVGKVYNNIIEAEQNDTKGIAFQYSGGDTGDVNFFNNLVHSKKSTGMMTLSRMASGDDTFQVINNTFVADNGRPMFFYCHSSKTVQYHIESNIFSGYTELGEYVYTNGSGVDYYKLFSGASSKCPINGSTYQTSPEENVKIPSNYYDKSSQNIAYQDSANNDFHLTQLSPVIGIGTNFSALFTTDLDDQPRGNGSYDYGAYAFVDTVDSTPPVMTLIGNGQMTINEGDAFNDPGVTAIDDQDGDISSLVVIQGSVDSNLPGTYLLTYISTDSSGNVSQVSRTVTVIAYVPPLDLKLQINFSDSTNDQLSGWNTTDQAYDNAPALNLVDENNQASGISLVINKGFCGVKDTGQTHPSIPDGGVMPDLILKTYWYTCNNTVSKIKFTGLDSSELYRIRIVGSRAASDSRITFYDIGNEHRELDASLNHSNYAEFLSLSPNSQGELILHVQRKPSQEKWGYINGLILEKM